jgi:hypothetical protein
MLSWVAPRGLDLARSLRWDALLRNALDRHGAARLAMTGSYFLASNL